MRAFVLHHHVRRARHVSNSAALEVVNVCVCYDGRRDCAQKLDIHRAIALFDTLKWMADSGGTLADPGTPRKGCISTRTSTSFCAGRTVQCTRVVPVQNVIFFRIKSPWVYFSQAHYSFVLNFEAY